MLNILIYLVLFLGVVGAGAGAYIFLHGGSSLGGIASGLFGARAERRLEVVEQASVDARRRLILIRRDEVEHLIMTGGPVDVVIETGIGAKPLQGTVEAGEPVVYNRPARTFGGLTPARAVNGGEG